jgi:competence protein ComEA
MKINSEPVKNWFGHSRRERRSSFILLIITIIILAVKYIVPEKNTEVYSISTGNAGISDSGNLTNGDQPSADSLFYFDPNSASYDTLIKLGLDPKTASTLISYRKNGGIFRTPQDLKKVYGIDEKTAGKLVPFVEIAKDTSSGKRKYSNQRQSPKLDINNCDSASLDRLPGIGPVLASRIIKFRKLLGGFANIEQMKEVYGLSVETYELISGRIFADTSLLVKIPINTTDYKVLVKIPYLEKYEVTAILKYRELKGRIMSISDLTENKLITVEKAVKVRPYLKFE